MPILRMIARMMSLGSRPGPEPAGHLDAQRAGPGALPERLRGQDVLDLAGADPEGQGAEGAVRAGVAVAADDRQARERQPQLGPDHVHDPLVTALDVVERHAELAAVRPQGLDLPARQRVADVELILGRHVVVDGRERQVGASDPTPGQPQAVEGLRAGHLVDQVTIDVEERRLLGRRDDVAVPDLLEQCLGHVLNRPRMLRLGCDRGGISSLRTRTPADGSPAQGRRPDPRGRTGPAREGRGGRRRRTTMPLRSSSRLLEPGWERRPAGDRLAPATRAADRLYRLSQPRDPGTRPARPGSRSRRLTAGIATVTIPSIRRARPPKRADRPVPSTIPTSRKGAGHAAVRGRDDVAYHDRVRVR